jgi:hypothetical protein
MSSGFLMTIIPDLTNIGGQLLILIIIITVIILVLPKRRFIDLKAIKSSIRESSRIKKFIPAITSTCKGIEQPSGNGGCNEQCYQFGHKYYDVRVGGCFSDVSYLNSPDFNATCYRNRYQDICTMTEVEATNHWNTIGKKENRNGSCNNLYTNLDGDDKAVHLVFNPTCYKFNYCDLKNSTEEQAIWHWNNRGRTEGRNGTCSEKNFGKFRVDKLDSWKFDAKCYKARYIDLQDMSVDNAKKHWYEIGGKENRNCSCDDSLNDRWGKDIAKDRRVKLGEKKKENGFGDIIGKLNLDRFKK